MVFPLCCLIINFKRGGGLYCFPGECRGRETSAGSLLRSLEGVSFSLVVVSVFLMRFLHRIVC